MSLAHRCLRIVLLQALLLFFLLAAFAQADPNDNETQSMTSSSDAISTGGTPTTSLTVTSTSPSTPISTASPPSKLPGNGTNSNNNSVTEEQAPTNVTFQCNVDTIFCAKVKTAVDAAVTEFTNVVFLKVPIIIRIRYHSFCEMSCANDTYGWGVPASQFTLPGEDGVDPNYVYPQSLAKQLALYGNSSAWADHDIDLEINHDPYMNAVDYDAAASAGWNGTGVPPGGKYWFKGDPPIASNQIDLEYIVLHELLHGIGFVSSWAAYFYTSTSPFRFLIEGVFDDSELKLVTPSLTWAVKKGAGPVYISGFSPTMIFDKYLISATQSGNYTNTTSLQTLAFEMQDFCVSEDNAFIIDFVRQFLDSAYQSRLANALFLAMAQESSLTFKFDTPAVQNSTFITNAYLAQTYKNMTLQTGNSFIDSGLETYSTINNRPGLSISHLDSQYAMTPDFVMTKTFHTGAMLSDLVNMTYSKIPTITYNETLSNGTVAQKQYRSPIGPGVLRILDSMGYSTVLTQTNYTGFGGAPPLRSDSCSDGSIVTSVSKRDEMSNSSSSSGRSATVLIHPALYVLISCMYIFLYYY